LGTVQKFLYLDTAPPYSAPITPYTGADSRQGEYVVNLCFGRGPCATTYDVYLDTVNPPTTRIAQGITGTICDPTPTAGSTLLYDTQYYWRVIAGTAGGSATGPVWSFRTITAPPFITGAVSRKTHGATTGDIPLPTSGKCGVECRKNGPALVIVTFDKTIQGRFGLDTSDVVLNSSRIPVGTITGVSISGGTTLTITMTGTADAACLIIGFPGIEGADESPVTQTLPLGVLYGDTTYDGRTNVLDLMAIKPQINIPVSAANFRCDINCDNAINVLDLLATKNNLNKAIGKCP
jgi:hypothetical protein